MIFRRVVLHGIALIGLSTAGLLVVFVAFVVPEMSRDMQGLASWFTRHACSHESSEVQQLPAPVAVYDQTGELIARARPHLPDRVDPAAPSLGLQGGPDQQVTRCPDGRIVGIGAPPPLSPSRFALSVAIVCALILALSVPLARSLVKPLRMLVHDVERFGRGDLAVRSTVRRRDEIGQLADAFDRTATALQQRILAEREMLANVSHELRTPLARVRVVLEIAREQPARARIAMDEIGRDLEDLERLTEDVLAMMRLDFADAGAGLPVHARRLDLIETIRRAMGAAIERVPDRELVLDAPDHMWCDGDPVLLGRVATNLLDNALKYSAGPITVRVTMRDRAILWTVEDRGIGIAASDLGRVFEPFFRADRSRDRGTGGVGLGLALCRRIVHAHHGTIEMRSEVGKYSIVEIVLAAR